MPAIAAGREGESAAVRAAHEGGIDLPRQIARTSYAVRAASGDRRQIYGAFFWINGDQAFPIPAGAYCMAGSGGQYAFVIPSHDLVIVRLGFYKGSLAGSSGLERALSLVMAAVTK